MSRNYKWLVCTRCFTYNHAPYIKDAMNGFAIQETNFPVVTLIVDDASTDGEQNIIRNYLHEHFADPYRDEEMDYAHVICARHKTNLNCEFVVLLLKYNHYSVKKSKFQYLSEWMDNAKYHAFCEGDDYWSVPNKLLRQVNILESDSSLGMVYSQCRYFIQDENRFESHGFGGPGTSAKSLLNSNCVPTLTTICKMDMYLSVIKEIYGKWLLGDLPVWLYFACNSKIYFMNEITGIYRMLSQSASHFKESRNKIKFQKDSFKIVRFYNDKYHLGLSDTEIDRREFSSILKVYAVYGEFGNYIKWWCFGIKKDIKNLLVLQNYKYLIFFVAPSLRKRRL